MRDFMCSGGGIPERLECNDIVCYKYAGPVWNEYFLNKITPLRQVTQIYDTQLKEDFLHEIVTTLGEYLFMGTYKIHALEHSFT